MTTDADGKKHLLHARGGVSVQPEPQPEPAQSSPRTWRCFFVFSPFVCLSIIFSTHVEVFLSEEGVLSPELYLLHARGGVSLTVS